MLKQLYVRFFLWALGPLHEAQRESRPTEIRAANGGWVLRNDGGLTLNERVISESAVEISRAKIAGW